MSVFDSGDEPDEWFEVSSSPDSAVAEPAFEGTNVCRVAALSTMLSDDREMVRTLEPELLELGFSEGLASGERSWADRGPTQTLPDFRELRDPDGELDRVRLWQALEARGGVQDATAFLVAILGSGLERESAASAAALWREFGRYSFALLGDPSRWWLWEPLFDLAGLPWPDWTWFAQPWSPVGPFSEVADDERPDLLEWDSHQWTEIFARMLPRFGDPATDLLLIGILAQLRLAQAVQSPDPITQSLAFAAFQPNEPAETRGPLPPPQPAATPPGALVVSTMIHGTFAWKGDWWRPRGEFHEYVLRNLRPNLYSRGARFSWSGALSDPQRALAARDFCDWAADVSPNGVQTLFAHSYGGDIAARAIRNGAQVHELVLLSSKVTAPVRACTGSSLRMVDVRLRLDPVLGLAQWRQRVPAAPNVTEVLLSRWRLDHGATHKEAVWRDEDVASRGGL